MKYPGSKRKYTKYLVPIINKYKDVCSHYIEPFVGGCNMIEKIQGERIGNDNNFYLIEMWKALQNGWEPPSTVSEEEYYNIKFAPDKYEPSLVGFVSIGCSYSGKWWGGYARGKDTKGIDRNYAEESKRNVLSQVKSIQGVRFLNYEYQRLYIPKNSLVYCDPPYKNTLKYKREDNFCHNSFWEWAKELTNMGNIVLVSEEIAPDDWSVIWSMETSRFVDNVNNNRKTVTEKLFVHETTLSKS